MKSFQHFYAFVVIDGLHAEGVGGCGTMTVRGRAPKEIPDEIAKFLIKRKFKKLWVDVLSRREIKP